MCVDRGAWSDQKDRRNKTKILGGGALFVCLGFSVLIQGLVWPGGLRFQFLD